MKKLLFVPLCLLSFALQAQPYYIYHSSGSKIWLESTGCRMFLLSHNDNDTAFIRSIENLNSFNEDVNILTPTHLLFSLQGATATLNVKTVPAGVYVLRVTGADGKEYHQKIVKR